MRINYWLFIEKNYLNFFDVRGKLYMNMCSLVDYFFYNILEIFRLIRVLIKIYVNN